MLNRKALSIVLFILLVITTGITVYAVYMDPVYEAMCASSGRRRICYNGRPSIEHYDCQTHNVSYVRTHACAWPELTPGQSCSGLTSIQYGYIAQEGRWNFAGCNANYNCWCESGAAGSVTCYPDVGNDSCGDGYTETTPTTTPTATPITAPPCNPNLTLSYAESCNRATLTINNTTAEHVAISNNISGQIDCSSMSGNSTTCNLTGTGTVTWTHNWKECTSTGVCSSTCSKTETFNNNYIALTCSRISNIAPSSLTWGEVNNVNITFEMSANSHVRPGSQVLTTNTNAGTQRPTCNLIGFNGITNSYECDLSRPVFPDTIDWTMNWTEEANLCSNITKPNCSATISGTAKAPASYFRTEKGDVYIRGNLLQTNFPSQSTDTQSLSTYSFSSSYPYDRDNSILYQKATATYSCFTANSFSNPRSTYCSNKQFEIPVSYLDKNNPYGFADNWFDYVYNSTNFRDVFVKVNSHTFDGGSYVDNKIIYIEGDFTVNSNSTCMKRNIFLISGDLTIYPDLFTNTASTDVACLFIVKGKTTIKPHPANKATATEDIINAFIVSGDFTTERKNNGDNVLRIKGGVITERETNFLRNLNKSSGLFNDLAAEVIEYDGARYIKAFKDLLVSPTHLSIREVGYKP